MPGIGALPYFLPLRFGSMTDIKFEAISYKGAPPAVAEAMGGQIPIVSAPISDLVGQHQAGTIRVLATSGATRSPFLPDVPTFKEQGFDIEGSGWYGIFAPAKTPAATIAGLNKVVVDFMHSEAGKAQALKLGLVPTGTTPAELGAIQHRDAERWAPVIRASGFRAD
jgi:tripartite-type tricarboxylate transporter receptor subunit TctC